MFIHILTRMHLVRTLKFCIRKIYIKNIPPSTPKSVSFLPILPSNAPMPTFSSANVL